MTSLPIRDRLRGHASDPLYRHSYLLLGGAGISAASGFVFWVLAARLTNTEAVGRSAGAISSIALLSYLTSLGLPYGILKFGSVDDDLSGSVNSAVLLTILSSVIASVIFVAGSDLWTPALSGLLQSPARLAIFIFANVGTALVVLLDNLFASRRAAQIPLIRSAVSAVLKLGALPLVAVWGATGVYDAGVIPTAEVAFIVLMALPRLLWAFRPFEFGPRARSRQFLRFSLATYPAALLGGAPPFFMPLIALTILGVRGTAYFYVAWNILAVSLFIPATVANMSLSEGARERPWQTADQARKFTLLLVAPVVLIIFALAPLLLSAFGHTYSTQASTTLRIYAVSLIPWTFLNINQAALRVEARHRELTATSCIFASTTLVAPIVFGVIWGLEGFAAGWTVGVLTASGALSIIASGHRRAERSGTPPGGPTPRAAVEGA